MTLMLLTPKDVLANTMNEQADVLPFGLSAKTIEAFANQTAWRRLLFFTDKAQQNTPSKLSNPKFFLAKSGHDNPQDELMAMLTAIEKHDTDAMCRFVARTALLQEWLAQHGQKIDFDEQQCADFSAWEKQMNADSLSLVFAEEHANNLASAFAHVLIRADTQSRDENLATAINYTVLGNPDDKAAVAAVKSIFGRYAGVMEILPFTKKRDDYLVVDNRDLWQYRLNLNPQEVRQIIRHIWEVKDMQRPYFFTHDNCATEIVRLIDVVRPTEQLAKKVGKIVIPSQIAKVLSEQGLVQSEQFLPSNATVRQAKLNHAHKQPAYIKPSHNNPATATSVHRVGLGVGQLDKQTIAELSINAAYQDVLDNPKGVRQFHDVQLLSIKAHAGDERLTLHEATLFASRSLNPVNTAKNNAQDGQAAYASGMLLGVLRETDASSPDNPRHLVLAAGMQRGKSWAIGHAERGTGQIADTICYVLGGGRVQLGRLNQGYRVGVDGSIGCIHHANDKLRGQIELSVPWYYHQDTTQYQRTHYIQPSIYAGLQYDLSNRHAIRWSTKLEKVNRDYQHQSVISLQRYF